MNTQKELNQIKSNVSEVVDKILKKNVSEYETPAELFLYKTKTQMSIKYFDYNVHFIGDNRMRKIYKVTLKNARGQYTFKFGQSIANQNVVPSSYDILSCLTKYDPESFEFFCDNYGYDPDSRKAEKIYKAVQKEYDNLTRLFTPEEMEMLAEIW